MATAQRLEWTRGDDEDPAALEHMALNGQSERVHALFKRIAPRDRARYASPRVLRQVLVGGLAAYRCLPRDAVVLRREESDFLDETLGEFATHCGRAGSAPRELFRSLLDLANLRFEENRLGEADDYCELAVQQGVSSFPELPPCCSRRQPCWRRGESRTRPGSCWRPCTTGATWSPIAS